MLVYSPKVVLASESAILDLSLQFSTCLKMIHAGYFLTTVSGDAIYDAMGLNNSIGIL